MDFEKIASAFSLASTSQVVLSSNAWHKTKAAARFAFFLTRPSQIADPERNFSLSHRADRSASIPTHVPLRFSALALMQN